MHTQASHSNAHLANPCDASHLCTFRFLIRFADSGDGGGSRLTNRSMGWWVISDKSIMDAVVRFLADESPDGFLGVSLAVCAWL